MKYKSRFFVDVLVWTTAGMMISVSPNYAQTQPENITICKGTTNTIRIEHRDTEMVMTAFYHKDNLTWLNTAAQSESTDTGINYSNLRGEQTVIAMSSQIFTDSHLVEMHRNLVNKAFNPLLPVAYCLLPSAQRYNLFVPHNQEFCKITIGDQGTESGSLTTESMTNAAITGTITYRERIALPSDAVIKIKLLDVSRQDTAAIEIASQSLTTTGEQVPISFELPYDASKIQEQQTYVVRAEIYLNDQLNFTTTQIYPVITRGHGNKVDLVLNKVSPSALQNQLTGSRWLLEDLAGQGVVDKVQTTLEFGEDNRLGGKGGCNVYFTSYELDGSNLKVGIIGSTQMMCPPAIMDQEQKFLQALEKAYNLRIEGPYLFIDSEGYDLPLKFTRL